MRRLGELLDEEWDDEEKSDVHIEELHVYGREEIPTLNIKGKLREAQEVTKPENDIPVPPSRQNSITPRAKKLSLLITAIITGVVGAAKIIWELWSVKK